MGRPDLCYKTVASSMALIHLCTERNSTQHEAGISKRSASTVLPLGCVVVGSFKGVV